MRFLSSVISFVVIATAVVGLVVVSRRSSVTVTDQVGVTVFPLLDLTRQVTADDVVVTLLTPAGADPHTYSPTVQDAATLERARVVLAVGYGLDDWITAATAGGNQSVVTLDRQIDLIMDEGVADPHYYLSPQSARLMVGQIADTLSNHWPEHAAAFRDRAAAYQAQLDSLLADYQPRFAGLNKNIATQHNAFAYLARDFGINVVASFEEHSGQAPTPGWLVEFQNAVRSYGLGAIYSEPGAVTTGLEEVARDLKVDILELDPFENNLRHTDYLSALSDNLDSLLQP